MDDGVADADIASMTEFGGSANGHGPLVARDCLDARGGYLDKDMAFWRIA